MAEADILSSITITAKQPGNKYLFEELIMISWVPIGILGLIGNAIVCYLFWCRHKHSKFLLYYQNIAIANFTVLINVFVYFLRVYVRVRFSNLFEHLVQMLQVLGHNTRFYILTAICAERCLVIYFPTWIKHYRPQYASVLVASILWGLSCVTSVVDDLACSPEFFITREEHEVYCVSFTIFRIILEIGIFLFIMVFSTVAILIRMQTWSTPLARLDITIVATVLLYLLTDTPTRITHILIIWIYDIQFFILVLFTQLLDSINCAVTPLIFLIVGCWKKTPEKPISLFLERALTVEEDMAEESQAEQEQT